MLPLALLDTAWHSGACLALSWNRELLTMSEQQGFIHKESGCSLSNNSQLERAARAEDLAAHIHSKHKQSALQMLTHDTLRLAFMHYFRDPSSFVNTFYDKIT